MTAAQTTDKSADAANYDLTSQISPYLDLHMMFPLLEYIDSLISSGAISYNSLDVAQARLELLKPTHMVDYAMDIYREVHGEEAPIPQEMEDQKAGVFKELEELREGQASFDDLCRNEELRVSSIGKLVSRSSHQVTHRLCALLGYIGQQQPVERQISDLHAGIWNYAGGDFDLLQIRKVQLRLRGLPAGAGYA